MAEDSSGSVTDHTERLPLSSSLDSTHLFIEFDSLDDLLQPVKHSGRIKYTCLAVCSKYIALGASTGSVYIFQKDTLKYLLQLTSNDGSISKLSFSRGCKRLAVVTLDSLIVIWELNIEERKVPVRILTSTTHKNEAVTSLVWDDSGNRVFAGDVRGWVTITNIDSKKPSGLFKLLSEVILKADSAIVQLDFFKNDLLVSTLTRCHICFTKRKKCATVGTKLRDGQYGACYWSKPVSHEIAESVLLSARPGSRIWEASLQGEVQKTHQFKKLLAIQPLPVVSSKRATIYPSPDTPVAAQSLVFTQLHPVGDHFLLAVAASGLYILNLDSVEAVFWTNSIQDVKCMTVFGKDLFCLHSDQTICKYTLCHVAHCAAKLFRRNLFEESLKVCVNFQTCIKSNSSRHHLPIQMMKDLLQKVKEMEQFEETILERFEETLAEIEANFVETMSSASSQSGSIGTGESNSVRLESGIHVVVRKRNDSDNSVDDHQDERIIKEEMNDMESLTEKSELAIGMGAGEDETDHPEGAVVEHSEQLERKQRSPGVRAEENGQNPEDEGGSNSHVIGHARDGKNCEFKDQSELIAQEEDNEEDHMVVKNEGILTNSEMANSEDDRESKGESGKSDRVSMGSDSRPVIQSGEMEVKSESQEDTCQPDTVHCDEDFDNAEHSNSSGSSISEHAVKNSSSTFSFVLSHDSNGVIHKPLGNQVQTKLLNPDNDLRRSNTEAFPSGESGNGEDYTDEQIQSTDGKNLKDSFLPGTSENEGGFPKTDNKEISSDGMECEILDEVFISSKEEKVESWLATSSIKDGEAGLDEDGGKIDEDQMKQEKVFSRTSNVEGNSLGDQDSLIIDGNRVVYIGSGLEKSEKFEETKREDERQAISSVRGLEGERSQSKDGVTMTVLREKEPEAVPTSPGSVTEFLRNDSFSSVEEDAKLIAVPTKLIEKSKKLKKPRKAARIVDIGTVVGQNAKNTNVPLKSPIKKTHSSPIPVNISAVPPSPNATSPSSISLSPNSSSLNRVSLSLQPSLASQNGRLSVSASPHQSPVKTSPTLQTDTNSGKIDEKPDGLANIGHSFKVVTRSLSKKLNKKSPLKRFKSLPSSPPSQEEESVLEVKVHAYSLQLKILEEATEMARFQLNDQSVCHNTGTRKTILTIWLKVLQDILQTVFKHEKQLESVNICKLEAGSVEQHASVTDARDEEIENEVKTEKSLDDMTSDDPKSYLNEEETGLMLSQFCSPSTTLCALQALEMEEELFMTCCQFTMMCFQSEIFLAVDEERVEADRADCETEFVIGNQELPEPVSEGHAGVKNIGIHSESSQSDRLVKVEEEFLSNDANHFNASKDLMNSVNHVDQLLSTSSGLDPEIEPLKAAFSSKDAQNWKHQIESSQRSSTQLEVSVLNVTMEMARDRDQLASHFIWHYLPLLDTHKVRDILDTWSVREKTFKALLMAEEELSDDSIWIRVHDLSSENIDGILKQVKVAAREKPVFAMSCLNRMQSMTTVHFDISDILHQCYPNIRLWEALEICQNGRESNKNIVSYMKLRMNSIHEGSRDAIFQSEFQNMSLRRSLMSAALTYNCPDRAGLICSVCNDEPVPLSSHTTWPQEELMLSCISICRSSENLQSMLDECRHHGYWLGVVELLKVMGQRRKALELVLKLADTDLLREEKGVKPQSFPEWHQVLQFLHSYLPVLQFSPWQPVNNLCVNCRKKMADSGESGIPKVLQTYEVQRIESSDIEKMDGSLPKEESRLSKEVKCSQNSEVEENYLSDVNSDESKNCIQSKISTTKDSKSHENVEISGTEKETSSKQANNFTRDDEDKTQKIVRRPSSSSPDHSNWTEVSPDHRPRSHLSWEYVANLLVRSVGSAHALKVLQAYNIPQGALTQDFYLKCLQTASIEAKQKLSHPNQKKMEEILLTMHPLLQEYIESEITQNGLLAKDSEKWMPVSDKLGPCKVHWGRTIDLNSDCQLCGWSLQSFKTDVCVYACGHIYHAGCTSGDSCVLCT